jgi:hypothetical protein
MRFAGSVHSSAPAAALSLGALCLTACGPSIDPAVKACFRARTEAQWGPWKSAADSWSHPAVPLSGVVRSQGVDRQFTMELTAFGLSGATDDF